MTHYLFSRKQILISIKNVEELQKLNKLVSLKNQTEAVRLQANLGKQNFHEDMGKVFQPVTDTSKNTSDVLTKTMMLTSLENLNTKFLEIMNDRCIIAS